LSIARVKTSGLFKTGKKPETVFIKQEGYSHQKGGGDKRYSDEGRRVKF